MSESKLDERLQIRVSNELKQSFISKCASMNKSHQLLMREMMQAVVDGRLKIIIDQDELKQQQELYNVN